MKMLLKSFALIAISTLASSAPIFSKRADDQAHEPIVQVLNGTLQGSYLSNFHQDAFLGIPFAEPPLDELRFQPPQTIKHKYNEQLKVANQYGHSCMSTSVSADNITQSEDCLTLNVIRPSGYENQSLPVAIWIYGGGFYEGSSAMPAYNLSYIVQNGVEIDKPFIGVSINYRLTGFGFLASQQVVNKGYSNVGLRDQIKAIEWIHENIAMFGGDPDHLVIWGESAGALSVSKLLVSGHLQDYVKGAIIESGSVLFPNTTSGAVEYHQDDYDTLVDHFNCSQASDSLECLQKINATDLLEVFNLSNNVLTTGFIYPYIDGDILTKASYNTLLDGEFNKVPLLIGTNTDEGSLFIGSGVNTTEEFEYYMKMALPSLTNKSIATLNELYPVNDSSINVPLDPTYNSSAIVYPNSLGKQFPRLATVFGDLAFIAGTRIMSRVYANNSVPVYKYRFNIPDLALSLAPYYGAGHAQELVYVFDNNKALSNTSEAISAGFNPSPKSANISESMSKMWANFITELDPNVNHDKIPMEDVPEWPEYGDETKNMVFDLNGFYLEDDDFRSKQIDFIESIMGQLNA